MPEHVSMPTASPEPSPGLVPVSVRERVGVIDILRGFALFGVVLANTWGLQRWYLPWQIEFAEVWTGTIDHMVMWGMDFFAWGRFYRLFCFLFGLGFAMQMYRADERGLPFFSVYARRLLVLLLFGVAHTMLRGQDDILILYAALGVLLPLFRNFSPRMLLVAALVCLLLPWTVYSVRDAGRYDSVMAPQESAHILEGRELWQVVLKTKREELIEVRREGTLGDNVILNLKSWPWAFGAEEPILYVVYLRGEFLMFLLGLYAGRRRIFENIPRHLPFIRKILWWGLGLGMVGMSVHFALTRVWPDMITLPFFTDRIARLFQTVGAPAFSLFYGAAIVLLLEQETWKRLLAPLAAVGRMPLTNYLLHTFIHTAIFYGIGLGLFAKTSPATNIGISVLMFAAMVLLSMWWIKRFRFGPAEWLWRTLTYAKRQPMLLKQPAA